MADQLKVEVVGSVKRGLTWFISIGRRDAASPVPAGTPNTPRLPRPALAAVIFAEQTQWISKYM